EQYDPILGQYYLRARNYDSATGRFTTRDPELGKLNMPLSLNKYAYAHNDPVNLTDPSGRALWAALLGMEVHSYIMAHFRRQFGDAYRDPDGLALTDRWLKTIGSAALEGASVSVPWLPVLSPNALTIPVIMDDLLYFAGLLDIPVELGFRRRPDLIHLGEHRI